MLRKLALFCVAASASSAVFAAPALDLSRYRVTAEFSLPFETASESSAITYNWDTNTLFVVGDEGEYITEVTTSGQVLGAMRLSGFDDTEGLTYIGNGQFVVAEERIQDAFLVTYTAGGTATRGSLPSFSFGPTVGNSGLEGLSYDPLTGSFFGVKEINPQAVYQASIDFANGTGSITNPFTPNLGVIDLSDIQVLSTVPAFAGSGFEENLLIFSQESRMLLEVTRAGEVVSSFDFRNFSGSAEGVTIDKNGVIYITDEMPSVFVLTPVPEPSTYALMALGLGAIGFAARRSRKAAQRRG